VISSWLFKVLLIIGVGGFCLIELASPIVVRVQLDDTATQAARDAADEYKASRDATKARQAADREAASESAAVEEFSIDATDNRVRVKLEKEAHSYLFGKIKQAEDWYHVTAAGSAAAQP
jgi:hypothetical protein